MVKGIKCLCTEIDGSRFCKTHALLERPLGVLDAWPMEYAALGVTQLTEVLFQRRIKDRPLVAPIGVDLERSRQILRRIEQVIVDAVAQRFKQRVVGIIEESYKKTSGKAYAAGDAPSFQKTIEPA